MCEMGGYFSVGSQYVALKPLTVIAQCIVQPTKRAVNTNRLNTLVACALIKFVEIARKESLSSLRWVVGIWNLETGYVGNVDLGGQKAYC